MKKKIFLAASVSIALLGGGCKKNFVAINTNPNAIPAAQEDYGSLFTNAELITSGNSDGNGYEDWRGNLIYASCMIQHLSSTTGYWDGDKYFDNAGYLSAYWDQDFGPQDNGNNPTENNNSAPVTNLVDITYNLRNDASQVNLYNEARIFKVYLFQRLTDMYGDIPYSQAGLGYISGILEPAYDKQQAIYMDMLAQLDSAASALTTSAATPTGDLIYGGSPVQWQKFAYSEMVRIAMRLSKVDPATAQTWVQKAVAGGTFTSNADNATLIHQIAGANGAGSQVANGSGLVFLDNDPAAAHLSETFVNFLRSTNDPRLPYLGTVISDNATPGLLEMGDTAAADQLGQPNGYDLGSTATNISNAPNFPRLPASTSADSLTVYQSRYSYVNRYTFARSNATTFFLTYAETQLLLAEAAQRGWINTGTSAATYYNNGVTAAIEMLALQQNAGPTNTQATDYANAHPLVAGSEFEMINDQYWVASFMDETESWANWRRSNYPTLTPINYFGNATGGTIPRRYTYSTVEAATNATNYAAAVAGLKNGDKMTSPVWWDVTP